MFSSGFTGAKAGVFWCAGVSLKICVQQIGLYWNDYRDVFLSPILLCLNCSVCRLLCNIVYYYPMGQSRNQEKNVKPRVADSQVSETLSWSMMCLVNQWQRRSVWMLRSGDHTNLLNLKEGSKQATTVRNKWDWILIAPLGNGSGCNRPGFATVTIVILLEGEIMTFLSTLDFVVHLLSHSRCILLVFVL